MREFFLVIYEYPWVALGITAAAWVLMDITTTGIAKIVSQWRNR